MAISVDEATEIVLSHVFPIQAERVALSNAVGKLLMEPLIADRDFPPFTRVSMDGIAIDYSSFEKEQRSFPIESLQAAGAPQMTLANPANCVEVMTGAVLPIGCDTVIRYEDLSISEGVATINIEEIRSGQNAHLKGLDRKAGDTIVSEGHVIQAGEIGVAATIGKSQLLVAKAPDIVIISTGDELVDVETAPLPHQIRRSNAHTLAAAAEQHGLTTELRHFNDNEEDIREGLDQCLQDFDVLILSGGVSKGKFDLLPQMLEEKGVKKAFHRVAQRPGKPFWFGLSEKNWVFAFPGNPVSSFMCFQRYFLPWWRHSQGLPPFPQEFAVLKESFSFKSDLSYFLQVHLEWDEGARCWATPVSGRGSGDLANLADAGAFLELPRGKEVFEKGEVFRVWRYRG